MTTLPLQQQGGQRTARPAVTGPHRLDYAVWALADAAQQLIASRSPRAVELARLIEGLAALYGKPQQTADDHRLALLALLDQQPPTPQPAQQPDQRPRRRRATKRGDTAAQGDPAGGVE